MLRKSSNIMYIAGSNKNQMERLFENSVNALADVPGIYYLKLNELNYVGSTIGLKTRLMGHRNRLIKGDHENPRMQNVFNKYSSDKAWYSILESNLEVSELLQREKEWIDLLGPVLNNKLDPVTQNNCRVNGKEVHQFDLIGRFIRSYPSTKEAQRVTKVDASAISKACRGIMKSSGGYLWSFERRASAAYDLERSKWKWKGVELINVVTGETLQFDNIAKAARHIKTDDDNFNSLCATISSLCKGRGKLLKKKYRASYIGDSADKTGRIAGKAGDSQSAAEPVRDGRKVQRLTHGAQNGQ